MRPEQVKALGVTPRGNNPVFDSNEKVRRVKQALIEKTEEDFKTLDRARIASLEAVSRRYLD